MSEFSLSSALIALPEQRDPQWLEDAAEQIRACAADLDDAALRTWAESAAADRRLLDFVGFVFRHSPFLSQCTLHDPAFLRDILEQGPDTCFTRLIARMKDELARVRDRDLLMRELRITRRRVALLTGIADIAGHWPLDKVTQALSDFADGALSATISHLLLEAAEAGEIILADPHFPEDQCGYVALAMGKHGGRELNYSSDIDLIILYEPAQIDYRGGRSHQQFAVRLTRQLIAILQEMTADGHVCRVDLNLRPDPGATPVAVGCAAAQAYYRNRGENWERAAMIKARPAAGDLDLGRQFLDGLGPFIWREAMDFWLLQDMCAMKRRINAHKGGSQIAAAGHNIKLGRGGIREIEFYAQTQQLIYGGLDPYLRCERTVEALTTLAEAGHIDEKVADDLTESYEFLRRLEHRLQMIDDQQTQTMPVDHEGIRQVARFMAFDDVDDFTTTLLESLARVELHYRRLFENAPDDDGRAAGWTFAPETPDERTVAAIAGVGVRGWRRDLSTPEAMASPRVPAEQERAGARIAAAADSGYRAGGSPLARSERRSRSAGNVSFAIALGIEISVDDFGPPIIAGPCFRDRHARSRDGGGIDPSQRAPSVGHRPRILRSAARRPHHAGRVRGYRAGSRGRAGGDRTYQLVGA